MPVAAAQDERYPDPAGYCTPANTHHDPSDTARPNAPEPQLPAGFTRRRIRLGGFYETPVIEGGPPDAAEAIVFMHGNPGSSVDFMGILRAAPPGVRVIASDLVGFGTAEKPWDYDYSLASIAPLADRIMRQFGLTRVHLVGHDIGGVVGVEWGSYHPEKLASATLINSGVLIGYTDHKYAQTWKQPVQGEAFMASTTRELFVNAINNDNPRPLPREFLDRNYDDYDRPTRCAILRAYRAAEDVDAIARAQAKRLRPHDIPANVIWGDKDIFLPKELAERQKEAFPRAVVHMIENSGHWPFVDEEQRVVDLMRAFFENQVRERAGARMRVAVAPRAVRAGTRSVFRVAVIVGGDQPVAGAVVRIGVRRAVTGEDGRATVAVTPGRLGRLGVSARKSPLAKGTTTILVRNP